VAQNVDENGRCHVASAKCAKVDVCKSFAGARPQRPAPQGVGRVVSAFIGAAFTRNDAGEAGLTPPPKGRDRSV
jgi:hypothetical protein